LDEAGVSINARSAGGSAETPDVGDRHAELGGDLAHCEPVAEQLRHHEALRPLGSLLGRHSAVHRCAQP